MDRIAVYPGTFDPITLGHVNIIKRASRVFDKIIVCVGSNTSKRAVFTMEERADQVRRVVAGFPNVEVDCSEKLVVEYCKDVGANILIRGLRALSDFEHECQMANFNHEMSPDLDTFLMVAEAEYTYLSSTAVKEMAKFGADISKYVPKEIIGDVIGKIGGK